jgi:hypothetical protein
MMIAAEEKIQERFPDRNNRYNSDRWNHHGNGEHGKKRRPDNTVAVADKNKKSYRPRRFEEPRKIKEIKNMPCMYHPGGRHTMGSCRIFQEKYTKRETKSDQKEENQKRDGNNPIDKGFQESKGFVAVIFSGVLGSRSKHQDKLALRTIMAAEPATPRYLN